jgi:hypothetical protein
MGAAAGQNLATPDCCHAGAKAMPTLAYDFARLIGAFHACLPVGPQKERGF